MSLLYNIQRGGVANAEHNIQKICSENNAYPFLLNWLVEPIQNQDKKLEIELDNIETQRSAVTTEQESVKKVIDENIEGSFNAFA